MTGRNKKSQEKYEQQVNEKYGGKISVIGKYTGYYYTFSMAAQVITPILSGALLEHVSYRTLFPYSVTFCILAFITMSQVKHGDSKPLPKKDLLENFDVED